MSLAERDPYLLSGRAMGERYTREQRTDKFVSIPPAFLITDETGATWIFGHDYVEERGRYWFAVLRDDVDTEELAERIEFRPGAGNKRGQVAIWTRAGRKIWNGGSFI